jgi:hypothetical protein
MMRRKTTLRLLFVFLGGAREGAWGGRSISLIEINYTYQLVCVCVCVSLSQYSSFHNNSIIK